MLRSIFRSKAAQLLIILALPLAQPDALLAAKNASQREPIDHNILAQKGELIPFMTQSQRVDYLKLERRIERGQSNLRSGQVLAATKPSVMDPDRDIRPTIERGKKLILSAKEDIYRAQKEMVDLLKLVTEQKLAQLAVDEKKYDFTLSTASFEEALPMYSQALLETCWELGYETIFFDGAFIQAPSGTQSAGSEIRNLVYDTLVKIDGTNFSVTIPVDLRLKPETLGNNSKVFDYENASIFEKDQKALLAIELIVPDNSHSALLSLRAIDMATQQIAAFELVKITDIDSLLDLEGLELKDALPEAIELRDEAQTIDTLSRLGETYSFELNCNAPTRAVPALLSYTLLQNSNLQITDSEFLKRAYGEALKNPEAWQGMANANFTINEAIEAQSYELLAQANGSERILPAGTLRLIDAETEAPVSPQLAE